MPVRSGVLSPSTTRPFAALVAARRERLLPGASLRPRGRTLLVGGVAVVVLAATAAVVANVIMPGAPARLAVDNGGLAVDDDGALVLNNWKPVQLPVRVYDARGHRLDAAAVRYRRVSGVPVPVTPSGVVTCTRRGDVAVRASLGSLVRRLRLRCDPIRHLRGDMLTFVLGDSARELRFAAIGMDDRPVNRFAGVVTVQDNTVVTLDHFRVHPRAAGTAGIDLQVGDESAHAFVLVYEPVRTLEGLRADQRLVAAPVRLAPGESIRWSLPLGLFAVDWLPARPGEMPPRMRVDGAIMCLPSLNPGVAHTNCLARAPGAWLTVAHARSDSGATVGRVALWRDRT